MQVAQVAVATGISPNDLLDTPPYLFAALVRVLNERTEAQRKASRRGR